VLDFELNNKTYGFLDPYIIAEIGMNYEGSLPRAKAMMEQVATAGGNAAKFQTYKADKLAARHTSPAYWDLTKESTLSQHELFQRFDAFGAEEYGELASHAKDLGIDFLSTPFDLEAVDFLTPLMPATKVASADLTNIPLIRKIAKTKNPMIISVGAGSHQEMQRAVEESLTNGAKTVTLMHCVLNYPTPRQNAHLSQIKVLQERFSDQVSIGYSDHVKPEDDGTMPALEMAALYGARVIEKHFTDNKQGVGNDHYHAMNQADLAHFVKRLELYRELQGDGELHLETQGAAITNARRRVIAATDLAVGVKVKETELIALRSNIGIEISDWDKVVGAKLIRPVAKDQPISWDDLGV
jgi:N-acetylneuraminate synthase